MTAASPPPLLEIEHLVVAWPHPQRRKRQWAKAVNDLSLTIDPNHCLALVGESGCGKTTLARAILRLIPIHSGRILFAGRDLAQVSPATMRALRPQLQMVFQDPHASLNPRMRVGTIIGEGLRAHRLATDADLNEVVANWLIRVGLHPSDAQRFPHALSGGQQQRLCIARALALRPRLLICDEAVSSLDVSVQAQILSLLAELRRDLQLAMLFISHDLGVVRYIADQVAVMYLGHLVEVAPNDAFFAAPAHPYSRALLSAVPTLRPGPPPPTLVGEAPSLWSPPRGCPFHPRCPEAMEICHQQEPAWCTLGESHRVRCWRHDARPAEVDPSQGCASRQA